MRHTAVRHFPDPSPEQRLRWLAPLFYDPVKAVRMEAARQLSGKPVAAMRPDIRLQYTTAAKEFLQAMERTADFAASRHNLGNLYAERGKHDLAITHYQKAVEIDSAFYPAKVNLAMLYNGKGNQDKATRLLREVVAENPGFLYALAVFHAQRQQWEKAQKIADQMVLKHPNLHTGQQLLMMIKRQQKP